MSTTQCVQSKAKTHTTSEPMVLVARSPLILVEPSVHPENLPPAI